MFDEPWIQLDIEKGWRDRMCDEKQPRGYEKNKKLKLWGKNKLQKGEWKTERIGESKEDDQVRVRKGRKFAAK